jgi:hypothetical protein
MKIYPKKYNKKEFNKFLIKYNVDDDIINKFEELPEIIERSGNTYKLDINVIWYNVGITHYTFEINYYSEELIEYLFGLKVYTDIELSINNMLCNIAGFDCIKKR